MTRESRDAMMTNLRELTTGIVHFLGEHQIHIAHVVIQDIFDLSREQFRIVLLKVLETTKSKVGGIRYEVRCCGHSSSDSFALEFAKCPDDKARFEEVITIILAANGNRDSFSVVTNFKFFQT